MAHRKRNVVRPVPFTARVPEFLGQLKEAYAAAAKVALPPPLDGSRMLTRAWTRAHVEAVLVWLSTTKTPQHAEEFRRRVEAPLIALRKWENKAQQLWSRAPKVADQDMASLAKVMKCQPPHAQWWFELEIGGWTGVAEALKLDYDEIRAALEDVRLWLQALCTTLSEERRTTGLDPATATRPSESARTPLGKRRAGPEPGTNAGLALKTLIAAWQHGVKPSAQPFVREEALRGGRQTVDRLRKDFKIEIESARSAARRGNVGGKGKGYRLKRAPRTSAP